jgi:hypothetical protein
LYSVRNHPRAAAAAGIQIQATCIRGWALFRFDGSHLYRTNRMKCRLKLQVYIILEIAPNGNMAPKKSITPGGYFLS